jgi:plastocyanin
VQHNALMLAEAANLLKMRGRAVAKPEEADTKSGPNAPELTPTEIQEKIGRDWNLWLKYANGLQSTAIKGLRFANARDTNGLFEVGDELDKACEACHLEYWYPDNKKPARPAPVGHGAVTAAVSPAAPNAGTIEGHVRLTGPAPANPVIRMGGDPQCSVMYSGKRAVQEIVLRAADGGLANVLVDLQGTFPAVPVPAAPVTLDQRGCVYAPRVLAVVAGQTLEVTNSDSTVHNVHSLSTRGNAFNVSQPVTGMAYRVALKKPDVIMRLKCDVHSWMTAYVAVEPHPYFAVTGADGGFRITGVPPGRHAIRVWHERYGELTHTVDVQPGKTTTIDIPFAGTEKPATVARVHDLAVPAEFQADGSAAIEVSSLREPRPILR